MAAVAAWTPLGHELKHDVVLLGRFDNGLDSSASLNGSDKAYVGVIAQEVGLCDRMRHCRSRRFLVSYERLIAFPIL